MIDNNIIYKRRSIRQYTAQTVNDELIKQLLMAGMAAPSARNLKPWDFYVIKDPKLQTSLKAISPNFNYNSNVIIIVCGNTNKSMTKESNDFWIQDCSAATENMLIMATSLGLGSLWCGIYPVLERVNKVKEVLKMPENIIPLSLIHFGYAKEEKEANTKYSESDVHYL